MARGWESKSVEEQMFAAETERAQRGRPHLSAGEQDREGRRRVISVSRARVLQQLQTACDGRRRAQLEAALADLDEQLSTLV